MLMLLIRIPKPAIFCAAGSDGVDYQGNINNTRTGQLTVQIKPALIIFLENFGNYTPHPGLSPLIQIVKELVKI